MNTHRLFFAFWPDDAQRQSLEAARQRLFPLSGRPVEPANLHLTAAFLGAVTADRLPLLMGPGVQLPPCQVELDRVEHWPKQRVLVASPTHVPPELRRCVDTLWERLARLGFRRDPRPFRPHVTLARGVRTVRADLPWPPVAWRLEQVLLVESISTPTGVRYEVVKKIG